MFSNHKESIGRWISMLHRYGNIYMNEQLKEYKLGAGQYQFLATLYQHEGLSQDEMTTILKIDKGTTARAIAKLEKEGYVERKTFSIDKRIKKLYLTEKAHVFEPQFKSILSGWKEIITEGLSEEEQAATLKLLAQLATNAEGFIDKIK